MSLLDKMMRIAGRDNEGKARAIKTDSDGRIVTTPQKGESEIVVFSKDNPLSPRNAADYEPRDTALKAHAFPHLWVPYSQNGQAIRTFKNIFDQTFVISNTLDADVNVDFCVTEVASGADVNIVLMKVKLGTLSSSSRLILTPEKTTKNITNAKVEEIPELRQPFPSFRIEITPLTTPTTGEIKILNTRRY